MTWLTTEIEKDAKVAHDMKVKTMTDREKRAQAAEKRLLASKGMHSLSLPIQSRLYKWAFVLVVLTSIFKF